MRISLRSAALALALCGIATAAQAADKDPYQKLRASMSKALAASLKAMAAKNKVEVTDEFVQKSVEEIVTGAIKDIPAAEAEAMSDAEIAATTKIWIAAVEKDLDKYFADMPKEAPEKKGDGEQEEEKEKKKVESVNRRRWVWTPKEYKDIVKLEKSIKSVQGYTHKAIEGNKVIEKTDFPDRTFYKYETTDYIVWSDLTPRFTAELKEYTEWFVKMFPKVFPMPPRGKVASKLVVVVFNDRSQYKQVIGGTIAEWSRGVFTPIMYGAGWPEFTVYSYFYDGGTTDYDDEAYEYDKDWNIIPKKRGHEKDRKGADAAVTPPNFTNFPYAVIQHEATHAMVRKYAGTSSYVYRGGEWIDLIPIFLNEGCATFFQNFDLRESESWNLKQTARLCSDRWLIKRYLDAHADYTFDLKDKMNMVNGGGRPGTWAPDDGGPETSMNYATAQSFCHYLLTRKGGRDDFRDMMALIYKGRPVLDESGTKKLEKGWNKHIREVILPAEGEEGESISVHELKN